MICSVFWCFSLQLCVVSFSLFRGQVPAEAENNYLAVAKTLEMYGVDLHPVFVSSALFILLSLIGYTDRFVIKFINNPAVYSIKIDDELLVFLFISLLMRGCFQGEKQSEYFLGLTPVGVVVYKNKTQVGKYFWWVMFKLNFSPTKWIIHPTLKTVSIFSPACHSKPTWMCFRMLLNFQNKSFKNMINAMIYVILWYMIEYDICHDMIL